MCDQEHKIVGKINGMDVVQLDRRDLIRGLAAGTMLAVAPSALSGCETNPETGQTQLVGLVSEQALAQSAAASWDQIRQKEPTLTGTSYNRRLENIGSRIKVGSGRQNQRWEYAVFNSNTKNAFVLPGNRVGFYKGIMDFADNDDQIAAVMGHEVGHVSGRHARERVNQQMVGQLAVAGGTILGASQMSRRCNEMIEAYKPGGYTSQERAAINNCQRNASRNTQLLSAALGAGLVYGVILPYSRRHELEADLLGAKYMYNAGYKPINAVRLWEKMAAESPSRGPAWMSTHPDPAYRAENLYNYIAKQGWI
jgi:predicted Zn-dependent protease